MMVNNTGDADMAFTCALHTYFRVSDIAKAMVTGLGGTSYLDSLDNRTEKLWESDSVLFEEEVDRVYMKTKGTLKVLATSTQNSKSDDCNIYVYTFIWILLNSIILWFLYSVECCCGTVLGVSDYFGMMFVVPQIVDGGANRTVMLTKSGLPDAVVWNPWIAKAKSTGDFGDEEYKEMLCVEPAIAASGPITVKAGQSWCGSQVLVIE